MDLPDFSFHLATNSGITAGSEMATDPKTIYVVDDDSMVRRSTIFALRTRGFDPHPFASGADFLESLPHLEPGCVLMDLRMPGLSGLQTIEQIGHEQMDLFAVIVVTGHGDITSVISAMKMGAVDFIEKPYEEDVLLAAIRAGMSPLRERAKAAGFRESAVTLVRQLTPREREVLKLLGDGRSNKMVAHELGLSPRTVEIHRLNLMKKLGQTSIAGAIKIALSSGLVKM